MPTILPATLPLKSKIGVLSQSFPPCATYTEDDIPDLTGKVVIVTGSNTGIGKECARALLTHGAKVYVAARSLRKAEAALDDLKKVTGKDAVYLKLDLGSVKAAKAAAEEFLSKETSLHLLFNSAGVMTPPKGSATADGLELQWGTNVVGHFVFTETLLPLLRSTAAASPPNTVRIITTSSSAHAFATKGGVNLEDQFLGGKIGAGGMGLYGQSKMGNIILAQYWAEKLKADGVISVSLNPGNIKSELQRHSPNILRWIGNAVLLHPTPLGAITQLYCGCAPAVTIAQSGGYFVPWARLDASQRPETSDKAFCAKVIELIEKQVQEKLA